MKTQWDIIIIGGGIAGYTAARTIMEKEPASEVLLVSGEDRVLYKRTKLSKPLADSILAARVKGFTSFAMLRRLKH